MKKSTRFLSALLIIPVIITLFFNSVYGQNLKVLISVDLEGISGVVHSDFTGKTGYDYSRARRLMTDETNAAVEGAVQAGAKEIIVNDSHGSMRNILIEKLHPAAELITGSPKPLSMMQGIDDTYDAVIFIGYHAHIGTQDGVLAHTYSSRRVKGLKFNGKEMNEASMNAAIAGYYGVPLVFVAGDAAVCRQVKEIINDKIETVATMEGIGRFVGKAKPPVVVHKAITEGVKKALLKRKEIKPYTLQSPVKMELSFFYSSMADNAELIPDVKRLNSTTLFFTHSNYITLFKAMRAMISLAGN